MCGPQTDLQKTNKQRKSRDDEYSIPFIFLPIKYFLAPVLILEYFFLRYQFSSVTQSCPTLCDPKTTVRWASLSITNSCSPPKPMSIESMMPSNHLILCRPLLLLLSVSPNIRVISNESALCIRWPKYWISASTSVLPMNTQD